MPPRTNGATRSITLIPVSKISISGERSTKAGGSRWIGQRSPDAGSLLSTGSPMTFQIRPRVCSPTGTVIGPPVSTTSTPRGTPSVESIATVRTRSSPRCCWTSAIRSISGRPPLSGTVIRTAWLICGSWSGKTASITTPLISMILPTFCWPFFWSGMCLLERWVWFAAYAAIQPAAERPQCTEAEPSPLQGTKRTPVLSDRGHTGLVIEASDVRADERSKHGREQYRCRRRRYAARPTAGPGRDVTESRPAGGRSDSRSFALRPWLSAKSAARARQRDLRRLDPGALSELRRGEDAAEPDRRDRHRRRSRSEAQANLSPAPVRSRRPRTAPVEQPAAWP